MSKISGKENFLITHPIFINKAKKKFMTLKAQHDIERVSVLLEKILFLLNTHTEQ